MSEHEVETTGHQWDDDEGYPLKEYNNPLPRWWLYSYYATIVIAVVWWILYPAWPGANGFTAGTLGWSQYNQLDEELAKAAEAQKPFLEELNKTPIDKIAENPKLLAFAMSGGKAVFGDNCAPCHGSVGGGSKGFPALLDDDWLYGGTLAEIEETIQNGRTAAMPAHLESAGGMFSAEQVNDITEYVLSLSGRSDDAGATARGKAIFHGEDAACIACHGDAGNGAVKGSTGGEAIDNSVGAPNLTDGIWLYGGDRESILTSIAKGRAGKMPAWGEGFEGFGKQLNPLAIKQATLYVHSLGGGQ